MGNTTDKRQTDTKEKLILAGLGEISEYGINNFSTRRVAKKCGLSCSAPYKHFKDTGAFIEEIFFYIKDIYEERQMAVVEKYKNKSYRKLLTELSLEYVRFLAEYPDFRRMIMQLYEKKNKDFRSMGGKLGSLTFELIEKYISERNMTPEAQKRKVFIVRSIIYTAAFFFENGELEYNDENMSLIESLISREFDLQ